MLTTILNFPFNFIIIPAVIIYIAWKGGQYTRQGLEPSGDSWYDHLKKSEWTPPGSFIGAVWFFLYCLTGLSVLWYWDVPYIKYFKYVVAALLLVNAYYNLQWSKLFFAEKNVPKTLHSMRYLNISGLVVTVLMAIHQPIAAFMFLPYVIWVGFATFLTQEVKRLNNF